MIILLACMRFRACSPAQDKNRIKPCLVYRPQGGAFFLDVGIQVFKKGWLGCNLIRVEQVFQNDCHLYEEKH